MDTSAPQNVDEKQITFNYPILKETTEGRVIIIKAGKEWSENRIKQYEGVTMKIPSEVRDKELNFAVIRIRRGKEADTYDLFLSADGGPDIREIDDPYLITPATECFIDPDGEIETRLTISEELLKRWTGLPSRTIHHAFEGISMKNTYNVMITLPRIIKVTQTEVMIIRYQADPLDHNIINYIVHKQHPIDPP